MTIKEIIEIEDEQINLLRYRSQGGDNEAAQVLLEHLRCQSKAIQEWKDAKDAKVANERQNASKKRQYTLDPDKIKTDPVSK